MRDLEGRFKMVAKTFFGLERLLLKELYALGAHEIEILKRAVSFEGDMEMMYKANLNLRTAIKILVPIKSFRASKEDVLYFKCKNFAWEKFFGLEDTFAIDASVHSANFTHSKYAALRVKDAIVDRFREKNNGERPSIDTKNPTVRFNLHISRDLVTISLDSSGAPLFKRGYRTKQHLAPINEVLAAAMVLESGWDKQQDFMDAMTGSGTIAIEAAMIAKNQAPMLQRKEFGFMKWRRYDEALWEKVVEDAKQAIVPLEGKIVATDIHPACIQMAEIHAENAGVLDEIYFIHKNFMNTEQLVQDGLVLMNPPYGERLTKEDTITFYREIADALKKGYGGNTAWIISSNKDAMYKIGLKPNAKLRLFNGALECFLRKYELF